MKIKETLSNYKGMSLREFCNHVGYSTTIIPCMPEIKKYYDKAIPLWKALNFYGVWEVTQGDDSCQIPCILESHGGGGDYHASARYYSFDRETLEDIESFYCFKCQVRNTSFDLIVDREKSQHGVKFSEIFDVIKKKFNVEFPYDIILEFDPMEHFTFDGDSGESRRKGIVKSLKNAEELRLNFRRKESLFCSLVSQAYKSGTFGEGIASNE